jgi:transcriptional regulator with XRE-family HTH domain
MDADQQDTPLNRLAAIARTRRHELGMSINALAAAAGTSVNTYRRIERGEFAREIGYMKIEPVLGWAPGSISDILKGAPGPTLIEDESEEVTYTEVPKRVLEDEDIAQAVTSAVVASTDTLTIAQVREITAHAVAELKRRGLLGE